MEQDFSNSVIYNIVCNDTKIKEIYVGSTANIIQREDMHKEACDDVENKNNFIHLVVSWYV